jgi:EAL domain-containing protein (putative c-di-GMP-specific phosphodiesterase class I)
VSAIIALGHGLKLSVIAEGVETAGQLAYLREMKCDEMQGFLFSRPVPASEITQLLHEGKLLNLSEITH